MCIIHEQQLENLTIDIPVFMWEIAADLHPTMKGINVWRVGDKRIISKYDKSNKQQADS